MSIVSYILAWKKRSFKDTYTRFLALSMLTQDKRTHRFSGHCSFLFFLTGSSCSVLSLIQNSFPSLLPFPLIGVSSILFRATQDFGPSGWLDAGHINEKHHLGKAWVQWCVLCLAEHTCQQCSRSLWNRSLVLFGIRLEGGYFGKWLPLLSPIPSTQLGLSYTSGVKSNALNIHFGDVFSRTWHVYLIMSLNLPWLKGVCLFADCVPISRLRTSHKHHCSAERKAWFGEHSSLFLLR